MRTFFLVVLAFVIVAIGTMFYTGNCGALIHTTYFACNQ